jgi:hypothetical protein
MSGSDLVRAEARPARGRGQRSARRTEAEPLASLDCVVLDCGRLPESARGWRVYADPAGRPFCLVGG